MVDYDLNKLSPIEFENLSRDLLEEEFCKANVIFESFSSGRDFGIDFRFSQSAFDEEREDKIFILQCKRYSSFNSLLSNLKEEVYKVEKLNPNDYYLTISIDLNPEQKDRVFEIFRKHCSSPTNILTKRDLNKLLFKHKQVELKYYKLWLSSTSVLNKILHSKIINYSQFEISQFAQTINLYVENNSFSKSIEIINTAGFVLITGIPGIGKTTLARILAINFINKKYEFIFISKDIEEAFALFNADESQIFYFDDFLGSNFHTKLLSKNEDKRLVDFISLIKLHSNKRLILTSREYIYNQASRYYEILSGHFDDSKFVINLDQYTRKIRTSIVYNHIFFSEMPKEYAEEVILNDNFMDIIIHENFTPRIIEFITSKKFYSEISYNKYQKKILKTLANPFFVWEKPFQNELKKESRIILLLILIANESLTKNDLYEIYLFYNSKRTTDLELEFHSFNNSINEVLNTFVILKNTKFCFINPSAKDFIIQYLRDNRIEVNYLIQGLKYLDHLLFAFFPIKHTNIEGAVMLTKEQSEILSKRVLEEYKEMKLSPHYKKNYNAALLKLEFLFERFNLEYFEDIRNLIINEVGFIDITSLNGDERYIYMGILNSIREYTSIDFNALFSTFSKVITNIYDLISFSYFKELVPRDFKLFMQSDDDFYYSTIYKIVKKTIKSYEGSKKELIIHLTQIEKAFDVHLDITKDRIKFNPMWKSYSEKKWSSTEYFYPTLELSEREKLRSLFTTLLQKYE